jgi:protein-disulfide isomerase
MSIDCPLKAPITMKYKHHKNVVMGYGFFIILAASMAIFSLSAFKESEYPVDYNYGVFLVAFAEQLPLPPQQTKNPSGDHDLNLEYLIGPGSPYLGNKSASVVVVDFSDFQCYLCKRHVDNAERDLNSSFIQSGEILYVFKHLPNRGLDSKNAAMAAQCTNDQGKFWDYHSLLYANQGPIDSGWVSPENLKKFASKIKGIDMNEFNSCFDGKKYEKFVDGDINFANSLGFTETPSFMIMDSQGLKIHKLSGPKPFPIFKSMIDGLETK